MTIVLSPSPSPPPLIYRLIRVITPVLPHRSAKRGRRQKHTSLGSSLAGWWEKERDESCLTLCAGKNPRQCACGGVGASLFCPMIKWKIHRIDIFSSCRWRWKRSKISSQKCVCAKTVVAMAIFLQNEDKTWDKTWSRRFFLPNSSEGFVNILYIFLIAFVYQKERRIEWG